MLRQRRAGYSRSGQWGKLADEKTDLKFLIDTLQTLNGSIQTSDLVRSHVKLLFKIYNFAQMSIPFRRILCLEFILGCKVISADVAKGEDNKHTLRSTIDSAMSTLLVSSS